MGWSVQIWGGLHAKCPGYGVVQLCSDMGWSAHKTLRYGVVRYCVRIWGGPHAKRSDMGWSDIARIWGGPPTERSDMGWSGTVSGYGVVRPQNAQIWGGPTSPGYGVVRPQNARIWGGLYPMRMPPTNTTVRALMPEHFDLFSTHTYQQNLTTC